VEFIINYNLFGFFYVYIYIYVYMYIYVLDVSVFIEYTIIINIFFIYS